MVGPPEADIFLLPLIQTSSVDLLNNGARQEKNKKIGAGLTTKQEIKFLSSATIHVPQHRRSAI
jgi:hypothetical protein